MTTTETAPTETTPTPEQKAETPPAGTETETPPKETEAPKDDAETPPKETEDKDAAKVTELPSWAQKLITDLRGESANYRTRATSAEQKLADAKTPEEVEAAVNEIRAENTKLARELMVTRVASEFSLPADLAAVLQGEDEAALKVHAKTLAKYAGGSEEPDSLSGGLTPDQGDELDPVKLGRASRRNRY